MLIVVNCLALALLGFGIAVLVQEIQSYRGKDLPGVLLLL